MDQSSSAARITSLGRSLYEAKQRTLTLQRTGEQCGSLERSLSSAVKSEMNPTTTPSRLDARLGLAGSGRYSPEHASARLCAFLVAVFTSRARPLNRLINGIEGRIQ